MDTIATINDLPDDILKIILRRVIVSSNIEAYFCINKRFTNILNNMSKKYGECDNFYCLVCSTRHFWRGGNPLYNKRYNTQIIFDNVCNICMLKTKPITCTQCDINFMGYDYKSKFCNICVGPIKIKNSVAPPSVVVDFGNYSCRCKELGCEKCYPTSEHGNNTIVLPKGFPYEINTYCPKKLKL